MATRGCRFNSTAPSDTAERACRQKLLRTWLKCLCPNVETNRIITKVPCKKAGHLSNQTGRIRDLRLFVSPFSQRLNRALGTAQSVGPTGRSLPTAYERPNAVQKSLQRTKGRDLFPSTAAKDPTAQLPTSPESALTPRAPPNPRTDTWSNIWHQLQVMERHSPGRTRKTSGSLSQT